MWERGMTTLEKIELIAKIRRLVKQLIKYEQREIPQYSLKSITSSLEYIKDFLQEDFKK